MKLLGQKKMKKKKITRYHVLLAAAITLLWQGGAEVLSMTKDVITFLIGENALIVEQKMISAQECADHAKPNSSTQMQN